VSISRPSRKEASRFGSLRRLAARRTYWPRGYHLPFVLFFSRELLEVTVRFRTATTRGMKSFASLLAGISLIGFCVLVMAQVSMSNHSSDSRTVQTRPNTSPAASARSISAREFLDMVTTPTPAMSQIVHGTAVDYSMTVPDNWKITNREELSLSKEKGLAIRT